MRVFAKWFYGFNPDTWPCVSLNGNGASHFAANVLPGDLVLFVGSSTPPTADHERGRLLGMAQVSDLRCRTVDLVAPEFLGEHQFNDRGEMRWPEAFPMLHAWRFIDRPLLQHVIGRKLPAKCRMYVDHLSETESLAVLRQPMSSVEVSQSETRANEVAETESKLSRKLSVGPVPSQWAAWVEHGIDRPAQAYVFRFGDTDVWKIGWSVDPSKRLAEVNRHIPVEVLGAGWRLAHVASCPDMRQARALEQRALAVFAEHRTAGERLRCAADLLDRRWQELCADHHTATIDAST